ncbi:helix-turn-helix domain-containing protein [Bosea sp. NPDC055332]
MNPKELIDRIVSMPPPAQGVAATPPAEVVAMVVRMARGLRQWKQDTLADFACVSMSTVERVERAEPVSIESLDRIAQALGYEPGAFSAPRLPIPREEAATQMVDQLGNLQQVEVRPFETHRQIRMIAATQACYIHRPEVGAAYDEQVAGLREWLDLASFALGPAPVDGGEPIRRRALCDGILAAVADLRRRGVTVLVGIADAPIPGFADWKVAIISLTPKLSDPGAPKRRAIFVDKRCLRHGPGYLEHLSDEADL